MPLAPEAGASPVGVRSLLIACLPETGHVLPALALAKALRARGHAVRFLGIADLEENLRGSGFALVPILEGPRPRGYRAARQVRWEHTHPLRVLFEQTRASREEALLVAGGGIDGAFEAARPDALLCDARLPWVALAARRLGVPVLLLNTMFPLGEDLGVPPITTALRPSASPLSRVAISAAWRAVFLRRRLLHPPVLRALGVEPSEALFARLLQGHTGLPDPPLVPTEWGFDLRLPELVLCPRELDFPRDRPRPEVVYGGPSLDPDRAAETSEAGAAWDSGSSRPLLYCAMGSKPFRYSHHRAFFDSLLDVMRRRPGWELLLVDGSAGGARVRASGLPNVRVVPWAPQLRVLRRARVMLTHGGLNSVKECIWSGVPMLVLPLADDQPGNGARVAYHGLGECAPPGALSSRKLLYRLEALLEAPAYRERLEHFGRVFREHQASGRDALQVEAFLAAPRAWPACAQPSARIR